MITKTNTHGQNEITAAAKAAVVETKGLVATKGRAETHAPNTPNTPETQVRRVIMGVDLHKRFCVVSVQLSGSKANPPQTIATERIIGWVKQQQAR